MTSEEEFAGLLTVIRKLRQAHQECEVSTPGRCPWPSMWDEDVRDLHLTLRAAGLRLVRVGPDN